MKALILLSVVMLAGCAGNQERSIWDRIEFDADESGCARIQGTVDVGGFAGFGTSNASMVVVKRKDTITNADGTQRQVDVPDC